MSDLFVGGIGLVIFILAVVLAVFWLIFPWMVHSQLNSLLKAQQRLEESQRQIQHTLTKLEHHASVTASSTSRLASFFEGRSVEVGSERIEGQ